MKPSKKKRIIKAWAVVHPKVPGDGLCEHVALGFENYGRYTDIYTSKKRALERPFPMKDSEVIVRCEIHLPPPPVARGKVTKNKA